MFKSRSIQSSLSLKDKILSIDYILVCSIFILGLVSILAMYSTDANNTEYGELLVSAHPESSDANAIYADFLMGNNQIKKARTYYLKAVHLNGNNLDLLDWFA